MIEILLGVGVFTGFVLILAVLILSARSKLVASGNVTITINDKKSIETPIGGKLLNALGDAKIFVSSACGGGGTCGVSRFSKGVG
jgi:Na+-transporting NADH:ubiquinone oxidoreductase subunit F